MSARLGIVLQARLGSTRLARKALLPLGGATLLEQVMARLSLVPAEARVLATDEASAAEFAPLAARRGFALLVGPAEDVLARYCQAAREHRLERLVRATGDNPLVFHEAALELLRDPEAAEADYASYRGMPHGAGVELVAAEALFRAEAEARLPAEREHVCPYLYAHPELFRLHRPEAPAPWFLPEARITVDTREDYERTLRIYGALYRGEAIPSAALAALLREEAAPCAS